MSAKDDAGEVTHGWLLHLRADVLDEASSGNPLSPASRPTRVAAALEQFGAGPVDWAVAVGRSMAELVLQEMPEFGGGVEEIETLRMGTESSVFDAMRWLDGAIRDRDAIPEEALSGDIIFVRRGIPLDRVLRGVRLGHSRMAKCFLEACNHLVPENERPEQMRLISEVLFEYIDNFSDKMALTYSEEADRWSVSAAAARGDLIRRILGGEEPSEEADMSRELAYDLSREHLGLTLWFEPARKGPATPDLETAARELLRQVETTQVLVHPVGGTRLWAWGSRMQFPQRLEIASGPLGARDVRVAIGVPGRGLEGFRRTHQQAMDAERTAKDTAGGAPEVLSYADVAIAAMLSADMPTARELVWRELGPLAQDSAAQAVLRETLLCYLEEESSPHAAAQRLFVARNTVAYRVRRASELLGYDVAERRLELQVALVLARRFGSAVLRTA